VNRIVGDAECILAVRFALPPGTTPEQAGKMLSQGGVNIPLGLMSYVRKVDVAIVAIGEPFTCEPPEDGNRFMVVQ
jgi:hypothetical protein